MFRSYRFEHPKTERSVAVYAHSYIWAGLLGAAYVRWIGYGSVLQAVVINLVFAVGTILFVGVTSYVSPLQQFLALAIGLPAIVVIQGTLMVSLVKNGFRRRGWMIRTAD